MAQYSIWILEESNLSISNGAVLDGVTQGDAAHLLGETITLNNSNWKEVLIDDSEAYFADSDNSQTLDGAQSIDNVSGTDGMRVEAEYQMTVSDGTNTYTLVGFNINEGSPSYGTVEGLAFIGGPGGFPPVGVALNVIAVSEGPGSSSTLYSDYASPICLTTGALIETAKGPRAIETLGIGDMVTTADNGPQPIRWIGKITVNAARLAREPAFRPVRLKQGALGPDSPCKDMLVSQQHRILIRGSQAELLFAEAEVLAAACHLINGHSIELARDVIEVTYYHLLFDAHEIITADGIETESFLPGTAALASIPQAACEELYALFPELRHKSERFSPARALLSGREARLLAA